jgi:hypothetical protein
MTDDERYSAIRRRELAQQSAEYLQRVQIAAEAYKQAKRQDLKRAQQLQRVTPSWYENYLKRIEAARGEAA